MHASSRSSGTPSGGHSQSCKPRENLICERSSSFLPRAIAGIDPRICACGSWQRWRKLGRQCSSFTRPMIGAIRQIRAYDARKDKDEPEESKAVQRGDCTLGIESVHRLEPGPIDAESKAGTRHTPKRAGYGRWFPITFQASWVWPASNPAFSRKNSSSVWGFLPVTMRIASVV
jgi:hypothetical protein